MRFHTSYSLYSFLSRSLWTASAVCLLLISCSKQPASEGARLSIEHEKADFGTINASDPIAFHNASLTLANLGKERIEIDAVELPKGFSYMLIPRKSISADAKATLRITMNIREFSGHISETGHILSNDSVQPRMPIDLEADIVEYPTDRSRKKSIGPDISFDIKGVNLGRLARNQWRDYSFKFQNLGDDTLKIHYIETNCLCLTAQATKYEVAPGDSAEILAKLEAYKYAGYKVTKTLNIVTNDPDEPSVPLTVVANIIDIARIEPQAIHMPNVQAGQSASAEARLLQEGAQSLIIRKIETSSPRISVTTSPLEDEQKGYALAITIAPDMPEGKFDELVTIFTNYGNYRPKGRSRDPEEEIYKNYKKMELQVKGTVKGSISVTPRTINFGSVTPGEPLKRRLVLSSAATPFEIISLSISDPDFRADWSTIDPGTKYEITVTSHPAQGVRQVENKLVITTTGAELIVPIFASVKPGP